MEHFQRSFMQQKAIAKYIQNCEIAKLQNNLFALAGDTENPKTSRQWSQFHKNKRSRIVQPRRAFLSALIHNNYNCHL